MPTFADWWHDYPNPKLLTEDEARGIWAVAMDREAAVGKAERKDQTPGLREWWKELHRDYPDMAPDPNAIPMVVLLAWKAGDEFGRERAAKMCDARADRNHSETFDSVEAGNIEAVVETVCRQMARQIRVGDV